MSDLPGIEDVLGFWFGPLDEEGKAQEEYRRRWFSKDPAFDTEVKRRFEALQQRLSEAPQHPWQDSARGNLAYIIVLDQLSRNMYRDSPKMYAGDDLARDATLAAVKRGDDQELKTAETVFLYMPLMHSERLVDQERCVELFSKLRDRVPESQRAGIENNVNYALRHRDIVKQWGRFPHRNTILGRESTAKEREFLQQPGSSF